MTRYFIELAYKGTQYSGFQVQENAVTIQSEVEKAITVLQRESVLLTGSSRTDAGVHALQNYFHFDFGTLHPQFLYKVNAILPPDIVVSKVWAMPEGSHSRFDAIERQYQYRIHRAKNPFLRETSFYYPYSLDMELLVKATAALGKVRDFRSFCKTNSQVRHYECTIREVFWEETNDGLVFHLRANRFLRGMVRLITATLLQVARSKMSAERFEMLLRGEGNAGVSAPAHGLFLSRVVYPENYFPATAVLLRSF